MPRAKHSLTLIALLTLTISGCAILNPASRLYGRWRLDTEKTVKANIDGKPALAFAFHQVLNSLGAIEVRFNSDGTCIMTGLIVPNGSQTGAWEVASTEGDTMTINYRSDIVNEIVQHTFTFVDENTISYPINQSMVNTVVLKRVVE